MNRRDFLRDSTALGVTLGFAGSATELFAQGAAAAPAGPPVGCAVIGLGPQGRDILAALAKLASASVVNICDTYASPGFIKKSQDIAPKAALVDDYKKVLDNKDVQAVFIATPSHKHKQVVLDAIAAGKHVYCEAPLASSMDEAKDIAKAGLAAKTVFASGLQERFNGQHNHVRRFVSSGAIATMTSARAQWHKKQSWKTAAPTPEREADVNWRLKKATSGGLSAEIGIHAMDTTSWYLKALPTAVTGFGSVMFWANDGMEVADTIMTVLEYPGNVRMVFDATLADSFDSPYELFLGSDGAIEVRDQRAWLFQETDAPLLGWSVYARKDSLKVGDVEYGVGIALIADATKLIKQGLDPGKTGQDVTKTALYQACDGFIHKIQTGKLPDEVDGAGALEGYQATVVALKANEAVMSGNKITFEKEWFQLG
jgi:predicted dehydrogenase